jgi:serine phosphatase RsbU (regulator of sigma subunit)
VALAACALALAFIPSATAKRDREKAAGGSTATTTTAAASPPSTTASTGAPQASAPSAATTTSAPAATHKHDGGGSERSAGGTAGAGKGGSSAGKGGSSASKAEGQGGAGASGTGDGGSHGHAGAGRRGATHAGGAGKGAGAQGAPEATEEASAGGEEQATAETQAVRGAGHGQGSGRKTSKGHHKEGASEGARAHESGKHGKTKAEEKAEQEKTEREGEQPAGSGQGGGSTTPALGSTPPAEALAPVASAASATPGATSPGPVASTLPGAGLATPARAAHRARPARRSARRHRAGRPAAVGARAAAGVGLAPPGTLDRGAGAGAARTPRASRGHRSSDGPASRIVTTITRIVDVVPAAARILIGVLLALALALAARSLLSGLRTRRLERQRRELLADVGLLQAALLPEPPARLGPVGTSVAYSPAEGPGAGGDFYDVFALEDGLLAVIVGDVSGHGRQALPHTALVRFTLRAYLEAGLAPRDALQTAGAVLERQLGGVFATVVVATYEPRERVLTYASAGHPPPLVLGGPGDAGTLSPVTICGAPPIGTGMRTGTRQTTVALPGRARVCFYTDGVTEARIDGELFGSARLTEVLAELPPEAGAAELLERVAAYAEARPDDMAACVLSVEGGDEAPRVLVEELEIDREEATSMRTESFLRACGVERGGIAEVTGSAFGAAGRAGTVVLEVRDDGGTPEVSLRRDHVSYLHARRAEVGVAR